MDAGWTRKPPFSDLPSLCVVVRCSESGRRRSKGLRSVVLPSTGPCPPPSHGLLAKGSCPRSCRSGQPVAVLSSTAWSSSPDGSHPGRERWVGLSSTRGSRPTEQHHLECG